MLVGPSKIAQPEPLVVPCCVQFKESFWLGVIGTGTSLTSNKPRTWSAARVVTMGMFERVGIKETQSKRRTDRSEGTNN